LVSMITRDSLEHGYSAEYDIKVFSARLCSIRYIVHGRDESVEDEYDNDASEKGYAFGYFVVVQHVAFSGTLDGRLWDGILFIGRGLSRFDVETV
jgi:hypothetical protein